jgi:uncharacterized protein YkwD
LSAFGYEQRPEYEYGPTYDSRPDYDLRTPSYDMRPWSAEADQDPEGEAEAPSRRRSTRVLVIAGAVVALVLVGAMAFAGTVLLGGGPAAKTAAASGNDGGAGGGQQVADPATSTDASAPASPDASPTPVESDPPSPTPTKASPARTTAGAGATNKGAPENLSAENQVLVIVNAERAKAGCKALTVDNRLAAAARKHSADMVARNYFSHTTPDGVDFSKRIDNEGYRWSTVGENIAAGQPNAVEVMKAWMKSPGHRANILNCAFRNIGIGVAFQNRRPFWTQDFGTLR